MISFLAHAHLAHMYAHAGYVIDHLHGRVWRVFGPPGGAGKPVHGHHHKG